MRQIYKTAVTETLRSRGVNNNGLYPGEGMKAEVASTMKTQSI